MAAVVTPSGPIILYCSFLSIVSKCEPVCIYTYAHMSLGTTLLIQLYFYKLIIIQQIIFDIDEQLSYTHVQIYLNTGLYRNHIMKLVGPLLPKSIHHSRPFVADIQKYKHMAGFARLYLTFRREFAVFHHSTQLRQSLLY